MKFLCIIFALASLMEAAQADIRVGLSISSSGPAASLGIPARYTVRLLPKEIAGIKVDYIVIDDGSIPGRARDNAESLVAEYNVDVLIGGSIIPTAIPISEVAKSKSTPFITLAPLAYQGATQGWVFTIPQTNELMARALIKHMQFHGVRSLGFIGYNNIWGDEWFEVLSRFAGSAGIRIISEERYDPSDASVPVQAQQVLVSSPDAIFIAAGGASATVPHTELKRLGYKGQIYHTHAAANQAFLRMGGKALDGAVLPVGPVLVWDQLPESHPSKLKARDFSKAYERGMGPGNVSVFGAYLYDAVQLIAAATPNALSSARPGSIEFRKALRAALESSGRVVGAHGIYEFSPESHVSSDDHNRELVRVVDQKWVLIDSDG